MIPMFHNLCSFVEDLIIVFLWLPVEPSYILSLRLTHTFRFFTAECITLERRYIQVALIC